jgi:multicomponent Na+:H+ antiporter subunit E
VNAGRLLTGAGLAAALFAFWLALSGMLTPFLLAAGAGTSIVIAALALRLQVADTEGFPLRFSIAVLTYWPWLVREILVSGWRVARIVLDPRLPVAPAMVRFAPSQRTTVGLATHANSITLTPGTITVEASQGEFVVHALTRETAEGLAGSEMDRRVRRLEGGR